jgi:acyl carrier protein
MKTNGKVDRAALPAPEQHLAAAQSAWEAPATAAERALATLWEETLGVEHAGRNDDFFQLGGHSLLAVQLLFRIRQQFAVQIPLLTLFEERTLQQLARRIEAAQPAAASSGDQGPVEEGIL